MKISVSLAVIPLVVCFVSCSMSDNDGTVPPNLPFYKMKFEITLRYVNKITDSNSGRVSMNIDYGVVDMNTLVYAVHRKSDGRCLTVIHKNRSALRERVAGNKAAIQIRFPKGEYYITFIAFKDTALNDQNARLYLESLFLDYEEAILYIPNDYVHYATAAISIPSNYGTDDTSPMFLNKMTTDLIFEFADADRVPRGNNYRLKTGVENIPSAFFIATGKTLTAKEAEERGMLPYSADRDVKVPALDGTSSVVTVFHSLSNVNLPVAERGRYWFEFKENFMGGKQIKAVSNSLGEFSPPDLSSSVYIYNLYD